MVKSTVEILQYFVAFSEYMTFTIQTLFCMHIGSCIFVHFVLNDTELSMGDALHRSFLLSAVHLQEQIQKLVQWCRFAEFMFTTT